MKSFSRRDVCATLPALAVVGVSASSAGQVHSSEYPGPPSAPPTQRTVPANDKPSGPMAAEAGGGTLGPARVIPFDRMPVRTMANGGESRDIAHGTLATGETVSLHESMQVAGAAPNPPHVIQHSEFILVQEGQLEFRHEVAGAMTVEKVGPGGAIYVAPGTNHTVRNIGDGPARYVVVAIGGDVK